MLEETAALAADLPGEVVVQSCDVRDADAIGALVAELGEAYGIDLLVNNAGGQFYAPATGISRGGWNAVIDLNLNAIFSIVKASHPFLARSGGAVINISISGVDRGMMGGAHALAARAGVLAMTRSLALEWAHEGIRLNCIGPGLVLTEGMAGQPQALIDEFVACVPMGRATEVGEIADIVVYLASDAGRMITGHLLQVDGGVHIGPGIHPRRPE